MKLFLLNIHLLSLSAAIGSMIIAEHFIFRRVVFGKAFGQDIYAVIKYSSTVIASSLILLWISGAGFLYIGYQADPLYITNEKIWAKVTIVLLISINGLYVHRALLPRLQEVSQGSAFVQTSLESALLRLSFSVSTTGWLAAVFLGSARFLNEGYGFWLLLVSYLSVVFQLWLLSYVVCRDKPNVKWHQPAESTILVSVSKAPSWKQISELGVEKDERSRGL